jgi:hypothetical protein
MLWEREREVGKALLAALAGSGGVGDGACEPGHAAWRRGRGDHRWGICRTIGEECGQMGKSTQDPFGDAVQRLARNRRLPDLGVVVQGPGMLN